MGSEKDVRRDTIEKKLEVVLADQIRDEISRFRNIRQPVEVISFLSATDEGVEKNQALAASISVTSGTRRKPYDQVPILSIPVKVSVLVDCATSPNAALLGDLSCAVINLFQRLEENSDDSLALFTIPGFRCDGILWASEDGTSYYDDASRRWIWNSTIELSGVRRVA